MSLLNVERQFLTDLLGQLLGLGLLQLSDLGQGLAAVNSASPVTTDLWVGESEA